MQTRLDWRKWQKENPQLFYGALFVIALMAFYMLVVMPFSYAVIAKQLSLEKQEKDAEWMTRATLDIKRLKHESPAQRIKTKDSPFSIVNKEINGKGWKDLVTDVRQVEQSRVQVSFNSIAFTDVMKWLESLSDHYGIFVLEATLTKGGPAKVQANLILQGPNPAS
jgi:type II secretory pathway component PulM